LSTPPRRPPALGAPAAALVLAALALSYAPNVRSLVGQWNRDPNYSYGFFVAPIAALVFWSRRDRLDPAKLDPRWWGFVPLAALAAVRYVLYERNEQYIETATIPFAAAALALALGGWHLLRVALPSAAFLCFMLPLPPSFNALLARPLQSLATAGSVSLLQTLGLPVVAEGNVIIVGSTPLEVARACNGLSMLLSFVTLIAATVILVRRPLVERVVLALSAVPIALISNVLRIAATAECYHRFGQHAGDKMMAHDLAGWAMMPLALLLVWAELRVLSWLFVEMEDLDAKALLRQGRGGGPVVS